MMSAALATRFCTFSNEQISQKEMVIAFERLFTKKKCFSVTISTPFLTQSHLTMSIYTKISLRQTSMCLPLLMTKAALAILC